VKAVDLCTNGDGRCGSKKDTTGVERFDQKLNTQKTGTYAVRFVSLTNTQERHVRLHCHKTSSLVLSFTT